MKTTACLVSLVLGIAHAAAKDGHVLARAGNVPAAGVTWTQSSTHEMPESSLTVSVGEQTLDGTMSSKEITNEVLEGISPAKIRRILTSKTNESHMILMKQEQPIPEKADPLQGLPVILELKDGKWTAALEEGEADAEQKTALAEVAKEQQQEGDLALYGDVPRQPGDKWDVDPAKLPAFAGAEGLKGTFAVEFVEVKDVAGTPCAVLKSVFDLTGTSHEEEDSPKMALKLKGEAVVHRSLADRVDLESKLTATLVAEGKPDAEATMKMQGPFSATVKVAVEKK